jgi:hypothetical protein
MKEDEFCYDTLGELVDSCVTFYKEHKDELSADHVRKNRSELAGFAELFHSQCGTRHPSVQKRIEDLRGGMGLVVMTAHQPNLFPYDGVMRKATLAFVLAKKLEQKLGVPVVSVFGLADQDFGADRWVKSTVLPDVERRDGVLELRLSLPEKLMLNRVKKPSEEILESWKKEITSWLNREILSIRHGNLPVQFRKENEEKVQSNLAAFWLMVEDAYRNANVFSDFNAFVISKIVNEAWGYDTLFARFSEFQRSFQTEFSFLLTHFREYSEALKKVSAPASEWKEGVSGNEWEFAPFWYHCDCGSKARLAVFNDAEQCYVAGRCLLCEREFKLDLESLENPQFSNILTRISARSISMPLVVLPGLGVSCYVGGQGGKDYLFQSKVVAESLGISSPPMVIWRPKDNYFGIGQLAALVTYQKIAGSIDSSTVNSAKTGLEQKIARVISDVSILENEKKNLENDASTTDLAAMCRELSARQAEIRRREKFSELSRDLKLINNVLKVLNLHPSIIDYAVSVGLKETSNQWIANLEVDGNLSKGCALKTNIDF